MGSQIAWQTAFHGHHVTVYDPFEEALERSKSLHQEYAELFVEEGKGTQEEADAALERISYSSDMEAAFKDADLVCESIPEDLKIKKEFWGDVSEIVSEDTILTTNSSSLAPSDLVEVIKDPARFAAMHFFCVVWEKPLVEVMPHKTTSDATFDTIVDMVGKIGLSAIPLKVEHPGYVINSLIIPWVSAALKLHFFGVADYKMVDRVWMTHNMSPVVEGPFALVDTMGMNVVYHVIKNAAETDPDMATVAEKLKEQYLDKGKLGVSSGEGFYTYPNPEYLDENFLK